jgi:DNA topoisomerase I
MATPEMTAELERDMDLIASGEMTKDAVLAESREMLHGTTKEMQDRSEDLAKVVWAGMDEDKFLGPCEVCIDAGRTVHEDGSPNRLRVIDMRGGKRFWGCEGYNREDPEHPDSCGNSGPLPGRGYELWRLEESCSVCGKRPRLTVKGFRGRPWKLCLNDDCPTMVEMREKRAERQAAKEAREAAKAAANGDVPADSEGDKKAAGPKKRTTARRRKPPSPGTARTKKAGTRPKS